MNITKRLILTLSLALLALLFVSGYGFWQLKQSQARFAYVQKTSVANIVSLAEAVAQMGEMRAATLSRLLTTDDKQRMERESRATAALNRLDVILEHYGQDRGDVLDPAERKMLEANLANLAVYKKAQAAFVEQSVKEGADVTALLATLAPATAKVVNGLKVQSDYNIKMAADLNRENTGAALRADATLGAIAALAFLLTGLLSLQLYKIIRNGLGNIRSTLQEVSASFDLTRRAPVERLDEIGQTAVAFNGLAERIAEVLVSVRSSSDSVGAAAKQIAAGNLDLSSRTEQQAATLEETAATVEQLTSAIKHNSDNARQANELAVNASEIAHKGDQVVSRVVETMSEIDRSSTRIAEITGVIEGIAFQTNILALNAAVEAARAGEQGRGFAVVATEVRSLAQRSSSAAKEIKELIEESVRKIHTGSALAGEAGRTMAEIKDAVAHVTGIMSEIAAASQQQSRGVEQVNQTITQMDLATQQNAALVEEAAAAAQSLQDQGEHLSGMVAVFRLDGLKTVTAVAVGSVGRRPNAARLERRTAAAEAGEFADFEAY
ncbi:MAG: hypothetical protein JWP38_970 [Herbaspirillum sp.]|nr:hypothetical protein [Herbaspirillum sp.]